MDFLKFLASGNRTFGFSFSKPTVPLQHHAIPSPEPIIKVEPYSQILMQPQFPGQLPGQLPQPKSYQTIIQQQQQLINECLKMNLQLMGKTSKEPHIGEEPLLRKRIKKVNRCEHTDKKHYAKGLCSNCYHRRGRSKKPWNCKHQVLYAAGMCQNCYINRYNKMRRERSLAEEQAQSQNAESVEGKDRA